MSNNILLTPPSIRLETHSSMTSDFPFVFHHHILHRQTSFGIHEDPEFLFFPEGTGWILYDGARIPIQSGDIISVNTFVAHQVIPDPVLDQFCLIIDNSFCRYHGIDPTHLLFQRTIRDPAAEGLYRALIDACAGPDAFRNTAIKAAVLNLLLYVCRHCSTPKPDLPSQPDPALEYVRRAVGFMKTNLSQKLTADEVAAAVGLSKFHFLREFKRITGQTMTHYLNTIRCEYAKNLLESGQYNVKEAAFLCGFTNNSYFSSVFLQYTGLLPSQVLPTQQGGL